MRLYLLNPPTGDGTVFMKEIGRCGRRSVAGEFWPQTGLAYVASALREGGHEVALDDAMALRRSTAEAVRKIEEFGPNLLVVHTVTPTCNSDMEFCRRFRERLPGLPIALIGTHAAALGEKAIAEGPAEIAVSDEGEIPLRTLADRVDEAGSADRETILRLAGATPGLWAGQPDARVLCGGPGPLVEDLDSLPLPARDLLPNRSYRMPFFPGEPFATVIPSRGCPWACSFCRSGLTWGEKVRTRSVPNVLAELTELRDRWRIKNVVFMTDTFTYRKEWVLTLCAGIEKRLSGLRWICNSRVDTVDEVRLRAMKAAGCKMVAYGVESGDPEILRASGKEITPAQSLEAIRLTRQAGLLCFAYFIVGLPGETPETIQKTIDFALTADPDYAFFHVATPFPGTELYELAKKNDWLVTDDWDQYEEDGGGVMRTEHLSPDDLRRCQKLAIRKFYMRPSRILKEFRSLSGIRDLMAKASAGVNLLFRK